jgi:hypothetical protein
MGNTAMNPRAYDERPDDGSPLLWFVYPLRRAGQRLDRTEARDARHQGALRIVTAADGRTRAWLDGMHGSAGLALDEVRFRSLSYGGGILLHGVEVAQGERLPQAWWCVLQRP